MKINTFSTEAAGIYEESSITPKPNCWNKKIATSGGLSAIIFKELSTKTLGSTKVD